MRGRPGSGDSLKRLVSKKDTERRAQDRKLEGEVALGGRRGFRLEDTDQGGLKGMMT